MSIEFAIFDMLDLYVKTYGESIYGDGVILNFNNTSKSAERSKAAMMEWSRLMDIDITFNNDCSQFKIMGSKPKRDASHKSERDEQAQSA